MELGEQAAYAVGGLLQPVRDPATGHRIYPPAETRLAHVIALLRRGAYPLGTFAAVLAEFRTAGNPDRDRAALRAAAALDAYLNRAAASP